MFLPKKVLVEEDNFVHHLLPIYKREQPSCGFILTSAIWQTCML